MPQAPLPFGGYLLVARLPSARSTWRAVPRSPETPGGQPSRALKRLGPLAATGSGQGPRPLLAGLRHLCLAAPLAWGVVDGEHYLVSELVDGLDLGPVLTRPPLSPSVAAFLVGEAARGVARLHRAAGAGGGLVHRRLSPRTLLVTASGLVKVCGLEEALWPGLAAVRPVTPGERPFQAPEQLRGEPLDPRADVFALGRVLGALTDPDGVPDDLAEILRRACATSRAHRQADAGVLAAEIGAWLATQTARPDRAAAAAQLAERRSESPERQAGEERLDDGEPEPPSRGARRGPGWLAPLRRAARSVPSLPEPAPPLRPASTGTGPTLAQSPASASPGTTALPHAAIGRRWGAGRAALLAGAASVSLVGAAVATSGPAPTLAAPPSGVGPVTRSASALRAVAASMGSSGEERTALERYLAARPASGAVVIGGLRVARIAARVEADAIEVVVRCTNPTGQPLPLPLSGARLAGYDGEPQRSPALTTLGPDASVDVTLRFPGIDAAAAGAAVLEVAGARLPGWSPHFDARP